MKKSETLLIFLLACVIDSIEAKGRDEEKGFCEYYQDSGNSASDKLYALAYIWHNVEMV